MKHDDPNLLVHDTSSVVADDLLVMFKEVEPVALLAASRNRPDRRQVLSSFSTYQSWIFKSTEGIQAVLTPSNPNTKLRSIEAPPKKTTAYQMVNWRSEPAFCGRSTNPKGPPCCGISLIMPYRAEISRITRLDILLKLQQTLSKEWEMCGGYILR